MFISEPTTTLTDYVLAAESATFAVLLWRTRQTWDGGQAPRVALFVVGFLVTAWAALIGGTSHGFRGPLGEWWPLVWSVTVWSILASVILLVAAGLWSAVHPHVTAAAARRDGRQWLARGYGITAIGVVVLVTKFSLHPDFNQNDLYHVIQMVGLYGVYRGARTLHGLS